MKTARALLALLFAIAALAACSRVSSGPPPPGGHNPWTIPGTLRLGEPDEPDGLDPLFTHTAAADNADALIYSYLLRYDQNGEYIPDLATQVPSRKNGGISKDGKTIVVHMRKGVVWSDGAPLTAKDWAFTYSAVMNPANNTKTRYGWDDIASVATPNDYTIVIHLKRPEAAILGLLAMGGSSYPPLPAHLLAKLPNLNHASFNNDPISSGPFLLKQWNHGSSLIFVANRRYFRGPPKLEKIVWEVIPDPNTLFDELAAHEIDVYPSVDENSISRLGGIKGIVVKKKLIANWRHLGINCSKPQLRDPRVRLAIAEGIDWKRINDTVYHGYDQLAVSDVYPNSWAAPTIPLYPYDPQHAMRLLAQAGWKRAPDGVLHKGALAMRLTLSTGTKEQENNEAEVDIQSQLRRLGFDIEIHNYPVSLLFAQDGPIYGGKYDLEWSIGTNGPDPDNENNWNGKFIPPNGGDTSWINDPVINRTSALAAHIYSRAKRKALYQQEEERIHQLVPTVFFYWENSYTATNSDLKHYEPAAFITDMWNAWQWQI